MAADIVVCENLVQTLDAAILSLPHAKILSKLKESLMEVKGALSVLAAGEEIVGVARNAVEILIALIHQADDLTDEIKILTSAANHNGSLWKQRSSCENQRCAPPRSITVSKFTHKVSHPFASANHLVLHAKMPYGSLKSIRKDIEQQKKQLKDKLKGVPDRKFVPCSSRVAKHTVIGRDHNKSEIRKKLLTPKNDDEPNVSAIPIFGLPGLGKSALAKVVYDDQKVKNHFDLRMWIQVSDIKDENEIIREIVDSCTSRKSTYSRNYQSAKTNDSQSDKQVVCDLMGCKYLGESVVTPSHSQTEKDVFHDLMGCRSLGRSAKTHKSKTSSNGIDTNKRKLRREIEGKLYLLVLDDACILNWSCLKDLLTKGARGSHILVTTTSSEVAEHLAISNNDLVYNLPGLSLEDSLSLFKESALGNQYDSKSKKLGELIKTDEMMRIGESIVGSCKGVPLTIRAAGGLLHKKSTEWWLNFKNDITFPRDNQNVHDVMDHVLRHSYSDLPTRLQACIGYCSLFPQDFVFNKHDLISLWIAQGFVEVDPQNHENLEEMGEKYFMELSRRYFFQEASTDHLGNVFTCKMHPLMHNLAKENAVGIMYLAGKGAREAIDSACKHVSFGCSKDSTLQLPQSLLKVQGLRTVLSVKEPDCVVKLDKSACGELVSKLKCVRVLALHDLRIEELPDSVGNLIHLRYLDLSKNDLATLPKSVTNLRKLQTLKLNSCSKLMRLLGNFGELVNLVRLELDECYGLISMPLGLEKLTQLKILSRFVVGKHSSMDMQDVGLKALKDLKNLSGRLEIELRGDWMAIIDEASKADLQSKSKLTELKITWVPPITKARKKSNVLTDNDKKKYEELLVKLRPHKNLKILCIEGYKGSDFPRWARANNSLPNLVVVSIEGCDKCQHLPPFGRLKSLKKLTLRHMADVRYVEMDASTLDEYDEGEESSKDRSSDQEAEPEEPPFFASLKELTLHNFYKLERWREKEIMPCEGQFENLSKLRIWNCPNLTSMPLFPKVVDLDLQNISQKLLEGLAKKRENEKISCSINSLQIQNCQNLNSFKAVKDGLGGLHCTEQLVISKCDVLKSLTFELKGLTSLKRLEISNCKELDLSNDGSNDSSSLSSLECLRDLILKEIPKMKTLPEGLKHVKSLKFLQLSACYNLKEFPEWIDELTLLQHLRIERCPGIKRLPDGIQRVKSLMKVEITECPELMDRCNEHVGEDWEKIKHARILLHRSWRYGLMSDPGAVHNKSRSNVKAIDDAKYFVIPVIPAVVYNG